MDNERSPLCIELVKVMDERGWVRDVERLARYMKDMEFDGVTPVHCVIPTTLKAISTRCYRQIVDGPIRAWFQLNKGGLIENQAKTFERYLPRSRSRPLITNMGGVLQGRYDEGPVSIILEDENMHIASALVHEFCRARGFAIVDLVREAWPDRFDEWTYPREAVGRE